MSGYSFSQRKDNKQIKAKPKENNVIRESSIIDESSLTTVCVLGQGGFGSVTLERDSNYRLYAKKSSPLSHFKNLHKELRIMSRFRNHPRIVQSANPLPHLGIKPGVCYIVMEFASKGTLHNMISDFRRRPMPEHIIGLAVRMILQGLETLHSYGYVHCDIKPANVLVFASTTFGEPWNLKLAYFGLSKEPFTDSRFAGTKQYMPPESFGPNTNGVVGPAVDIWSLGCVVLEMFGGCPEKMGHLYTWRLPQLVSPVANDFLRRCMALQPSQRATAAELLNHPFVTQKVCIIPQPVLLSPLFITQQKLSPPYPIIGQPVDWSVNIKRTKLKSETLIGTEGSIEEKKQNMGLSIQQQCKPTQPTSQSNQATVMLNENRAGSVQPYRPLRTAPPPHQIQLMNRYNILSGIQS